MYHTIKRGTKSKTILVFARGRGSSGQAGLSADSPGALAAWVRDTDTEAHLIQLRKGRLGAYRAGGFAEIDREAMPGVYHLSLPDDLLDDGAESAILLLRFDDAIVEPVSISLVAYDPQDEDRLGMEAIGPEGRIRALRGAFPLLTRRELDEAMARREGSRE
jgi:hypothetical protein